MSPSLGSYKHEMSDSQAISVYTDLVNKGALTYPSNEWVDSVTLMYDIFNTHHGSKVFITINFCLFSQTKSLNENQFQKDLAHFQN